MPGKHTVKSDIYMGDIILICVDLDVAVTDLNTLAAVDDNLSSCVLELLHLQFFEAWWPH